MRLTSPTPTSDPLPFYRADEPVQIPPGASRVILRGDAVARFDALLHELNPDAARVDIDRMQHLADWLLSMSPERARDVLERRLERIDELRAMLMDSAWDTDPAFEARLRKLLDYLDRDDDLIADHQPLLGLLDDVLLIELAWPAFAGEAEDYEDFCAYRQEAHPDGDGATQRAAWIRDRLASIALWQHRIRVHDSRYVQRGQPNDFFHVS